MLKCEGQKFSSGHEKRVEHSMMLLTRKATPQQHLHPPLTPKIGSIHTGISNTLVISVSNID